MNKTTFLWLSVLVLNLLSLPSIEAAAPPQLLWKHENTNAVSARGTSLPAIGYDGTSYFPSGPYLDALTPGGILKWRATFPIADPTNQYASAILTPTVLPNGILLVTPGEQAMTNNLFAVNPTNGSIIWAKPWVPLSIAAGRKGVFIIDSTNLHSLDANGDAKWSAPYDRGSQQITPTLAIGPEGNLYVGGALVSAYTQEGELLWTNSFVGVTSLIEVSDEGDVYANSQPFSDLVAIFDSNGNQTRVLRIPGLIQPSGNIAGVRSRGVTPDPECCFITSLTPQGDILWDYKASPNGALAINAEGDIYAFVYDYSAAPPVFAVIALTPTGTLKWTIPLEPTLAYGWVTIGHDGTLYVAEKVPATGNIRYGRLLAYAAGVPVASNNWPLPGRDPANSRSQEKPFFGVNLQPSLSRTSIVLQADVKADLALTAILELGESPETLTGRRTLGITDSNATQRIQFAFTDLQSSQRFYYEITLSNQTTIVKLPIASFETPGPNENIELTGDALRFAVLGGGTVTFRTNGTIHLTNEIPIRADTIIDAGALDITIDGGGVTRLFSIASASVTMQGLKLVNARFEGADALISCIGFGTNAVPGLGGGVWATNAHLTVVGCLFSNNVVQGGEGEFLTCLVSVPSAEAAGGAIFATGGSLQVKDCQFIDCFANGGSGGSWMSSYYPGESSGGAIAARNCAVRVESSVFDRNTLGVNWTRYDITTPRGGAVYLSNSPAEFVATGFRSNTATFGGAIFSDAPLSLVDSSFDRNRAVGPSHRILAFPGRGGAVFSSSTNELVCNRTTFTRNTVRSGTYGEASITIGTDAEGGALYCSPGPLAATNCLFAHNLAEPLYNAHGRGGAIACGNAIFDSCTIVSNRVEFVAHTNFGIAGIFVTNGTVALHSVVLSNSKTSIDGPIQDLGYNLSSDNSIAFTKQSSRANIDARLGQFFVPDGYRGFFTLPPDSPAADAGDTDNFPATDLFRVPRPVGPAPDIGAIEVTPVPTITVVRNGADLLLSIRTGFGHAATVDASTNLQTWQELYTSPPAAEFQVPLEQNARYHFFRVRETGETGQR